MALITTYTPVREAGNGSKVDFDFDFEVLSASDLSVGKILNSTEVKTDMVLGVDFTVTLDAVTRKGTVHYAVAPTALQDSWIGRNVAITQPADIPTNNIFRETQMENALDRQAMISQQLKENLGRALLLPETSDLTNIDIPTPVAGRTLKWNSTEDGLENSSSDPDLASDFADAAAASAVAAGVAQTAAEAAQTAAEVAQTAAELAETNAETAEANAEAAAAAINIRSHSQSFDADDLVANVLTLTYPVGYDVIKFYTIYDNNGKQIGTPDEFDTDTLAMTLASFVTAGILTSATTWRIESVWGPSA